MRRLRDYRLIEFRQVCAIARVVILRDPAIDDAEWKAATLEACAKQGWDNPSSDMLARALSAVERLLEQTMGPRPAPLPSASPSATAPDQPPLSHTDACTILARLGVTGPIKGMPNVRPLTLRGAEREKALRIVAQGIAEQVQRCEAAERVVDEEPSK